MKQQQARTEGGVEEEGEREIKRAAD